MAFLLYVENDFEPGQERTELFVGESAMHGICIPYASYLMTQVPDWLTGMRYGTGPTCMARAHCRQAMGMAPVYFVQLCRSLCARANPEPMEEVTHGAGRTHTSKLRSTVPTILMPHCFGTSGVLSQVLKNGGAYRSRMLRKTVFSSGLWMARQLKSTARCFGAGARTERIQTVRARTET